MEWLKNFDLRRWWIAAIAVGVAVVFAALAAKDRDVVLIGLGIVSCGFGEWLNHRMEMEIGPRGTLTMTLGPGFKHGFEVGKPSGENLLENGR